MLKGVLWLIAQLPAVAPRLRLAALLLAGLLAVGAPELLPLLVRLCVSSSSNLPPSLP